MAEKVKIQGRITYQGGAKRPAIAIRRADRDRYFSSTHSNVTIEIDARKTCTRLQPSFFGRVPQIRTQYADPNRASPNLLVEWLHKHKVALGDEIWLEVIDKYKSFRLKV